MLLIPFSVFIAILGAIESGLAAMQPLVSASFDPIMASSQSIHRQAPCRLVGAVSRNTVTGGDGEAVAQRC